jgi:hypothetical protein
LGQIGQHRSLPRHMSKAVAHRTSGSFLLGIACEGYTLGHAARPMVDWQLRRKAQPCPGHLAAAPGGANAHPKVGARDWPE